MSPANETCGLPRTPYRGSASAGWEQIARNFARLAPQDPHKRFIGASEVDSDMLDIIHEEFVNIAYHDGIRIHSFQENRGIFGTKGVYERVHCHSMLEVSKVIC